MLNEKRILVICTLVGLVVGAGAAAYITWQISQATVQGVVQNVMALQETGATVSHPTKVIEVPESLTEHYKEIKEKVPSVKPTLVVEAETNPMFVKCVKDVELTVRCKVLSITTDDGVVAVIGRGQIVQDGEVVAEAPFDSQKSFSSVVPLVLTPSPQWGIGPVITMSQHGLSYGGMVLTPTVEVGAFEIGGLGGLTVGSVDQIIVGGFVRW